MINSGNLERKLMVGSYINYVTESYLNNWIAIKIAGGYDLNLMQLINVYHRDSIQAICDYIFEIYEDKIIYNSHHLNSVFNEAMEFLGFSRDQFLKFEKKHDELVLSQSL